MHYRDDDLDELSDDDRNGQEIKINTFLLTFSPQLFPDPFACVFTMYK
jgi:hypothetical protein